VLVLVLFNDFPQVTQLLQSGAILNLTSYGILPLSQLPITDELPSPAEAMDENNVFPAFHSHNSLLGNSQEPGNGIYSNAEFLGRLDAAK
jgi:hypothetical protein